MSHKKEGEGAEWKKGDRITDLACLCLVKDKKEKVRTIY